MRGSELAQDVGQCLGGRVQLFGRPGRAHAFDKHQSRSGQRRRGLQVQRFGQPPEVCGGESPQVRRRRARDGRLPSVQDALRCGVDFRDASNQDLQVGLCGGRAGNPIRTNGQFRAVLGKGVLPIQSQLVHGCFARRGSSSPPIRRRSLLPNKARNQKPWQGVWRPCRINAASRAGGHLQKHSTTSTGLRTACDGCEQGVADAQSSPLARSYS